MACAALRGREKIHATVIFPILSAQKTMQSKFTTKWISINLKQDFWMRRINEACRFKNRRIDPYLNLRSNFPVLNQVFEEIHTDVCGIPRSISALGDHRFWHPFWVLNRFFRGEPDKDIQRCTPLVSSNMLENPPLSSMFFFWHPTNFWGIFQPCFDMFDEARGIQRPIFFSHGMTEDLFIFYLVAN